MGPACQDEKPLTISLMVWWLHAHPVHSSLRSGPITMPNSMRMKNIFFKKKHDLSGLRTCFWKVIVLINMPNKGSSKNCARLENITSYKRTKKMSYKYKSASIFCFVSCHYYRFRHHCRPQHCRIRENRQWCTLPSLKTRKWLRLG